MDVWRGVSAEAKEDTLALRSTVDLLGEAGARWVVGKACASIVFRIPRPSRFRDMKELWEITDFHS